MLDLSNMVSSLKPSATVALNEKANSLKKEGKDIVNLAIGEPDYPTPPSVVEEAIKALNEGKTKYGASGGGILLKNAILNKIKKENKLDYSTDEVVVGIGGKEVLFHIFLSILNPDDEVIIFTPYWLSYKTHVNLCGAKLVPVDPDIHEKEVNIDIEALDRAFTHKTKAIILNSPNNPGGYVFSKDNLEKLGRYLLNKNIYIISDEIYEYFSFEKKHYSILNIVPELKDRTIIVNGLSKSYSMTGWRVGYAVGPRSLIKTVKSLESQSSTCLPPFIEAAAIKALDTGISLVSYDLETIRKRKDFMVAELSTIENISFIPPEGAFYLFVDISKKYSDTRGHSDMEVAEYLLEKYGVAVVPGSVFGKEGFLRLSYATAFSDLEKGAQRLKQAFTD